MLMSKSRLEKFLYALYSLDSSDLPNPLSRIEELYKCLVTGEEPPTFEPLSRVEKYLMAILGVYDVNELPNPISRVEVLLHKLATGDDNLDDVKSFLSEHEELLAEIIRNGGAGGNIDIEYVLYTLSTEFNTLYDTAEKPIKSAILKGQTLVNVVSTCWFADSTKYFGIELNNYKNNQSYMLIMFNVPNNIKRIYIGNLDGSIIWTDYTKNFIENKNCIMLKITCPSNYDGTSILPHFQYVDDERPSSINNIECMLIEYQDGMENWDIPYFEGMQSVKMPVLTTAGKNLAYLEQGYINSGNGNDASHEDSIRTNYISIDPQLRYSIYGLNENASSFLAFYDCNKNFISRTSGAKRKDMIIIPTTTPTNARYVRLTNYGSDKNSVTLDAPIMIEQGYPTSYEPFKSNILTVNEEVELRGIDEVKDELNLLTGELTQRIGEVVFDGSEDWQNFISNQDDNTVAFSLPKTFMHFRDAVEFMICDKYKIYGTTYNYDEECMGINADEIHHIQLRILKTKASTVAELKTYLSSNPIKLQGALSTESVKTVDLSVADQDGNDTKLKTFNDITHVELSSEGLIPEAELEVATKNEEVLNTLSLEMDDISTAQTTLEETSNAQSENVDSTMLATTEIYEGLL